MPAAAATAPRKLPGQARSRAMVEALLDATARVLVEVGYAGTTTNRVAERAGISIGSLYQYFPSREALVAAVARLHSVELKARVEQDLQRLAGLDLRGAVHALLQGVIDIHATEPALHRVLDEEVPRFGELDWRADVRQRGVDLTRAFLEARSADLRPDLDRDAAAFLIAQTVEGVISTAVRDRLPDLLSGRIQEELTDLAVRYLAA